MLQLLKNKRKKENYLKKKRLKKSWIILMTVLTISANFMIKKFKMSLRMRELLASSSVCAASKKPGKKTNQLPRGSRLQGKWQKQQRTG
jgi:hypothetical protein